MPRKKQWFKSKVNTFPFEMSKRSRTLAFAPLNFRHTKNTKIRKKWNIRDLTRLNQYFIVLYFMKISSNRRNKRPNPASIRLNCSKSSGFSYDFKNDGKKSAMFTFMSKDKEFWNVVTVLISFLVYFQHQLAKPNATKTNIRWQKNEGVRCSHM